MPAGGASLFSFSGKEVLNKSSEIRELTKGEKKAIRGLVLNHCANHDSKLGCIVMDGKCYMLQKEYCSNSLCKYFRNVVLPNDPVLEAALTEVPVKQCPICVQRFPKESRRKYCSDTCARTARKNLYKKEEII